MQFYFFTRLLRKINFIITGAINEIKKTIKFFKTFQHLLCRSEIRYDIKDVEKFYIENIPVVALEQWLTKR